MFTVGDRVAWSHRLGALFGVGVVLKESVVRSQDPHAVFGAVTALENDKGTHLRVAFDADEIARIANIDMPTHDVPDNGVHVLTFEEIVKIAPEPEKPAQ